MLQLGVATVDCLVCEAQVAFVRVTLTICLFNVIKNRPPKCLEDHTGAYSSSQHK